MDQLAIAREHLAHGRTQQAMAALDAAIRAGDAAAAYEVAIWYLRGDFIPRDLSRARAYLRRAVEIGHADSALLEVALVATGSGDLPDWRRALALLRVAATADPVAAHHLALIEAMQLDDDGNPAQAIHPEVLSGSPYIARFPRVLSGDECEHIAQIANPTMAPSLVVDPATGRNVAHPIRSSDGTVIGPTRETLVIGAINRRIARLTGTHVEQGEPLSILRYAPGQQYRPHFDSLPATRNQRTMTAITYLNDGFTGGETRFDRVDITVRPGAGDLLLFQNVTADGRPDQATRHAGLPVRSGVKWIATRWIREHRYDPWTYREGQ